MKPTCCLCLKPIRRESGKHGKVRNFNMMTKGQWAHVSCYDQMYEDYMADWNYVLFGKGKK